MEPRKVVVYEWQGIKGQGKKEKVSIGHGVFHQWGCDYQEFDTGAGNFTTAIVEMPSGEVLNVPAEMIVFNN